MSDQDLYAQGYAEGTNDPAHAPGLLKRTGEFPAMYLKGVADGIAGKPPANLQNTPPPPAKPAPGSGGVYVDPPPAAPPGTPKPTTNGPVGPITPAPQFDPNNRPPLPPGPRARFYEVVAMLPFLGKIPFDAAINVQHQPGGNLILNFVESLVSFQVLGSIPSDWQEGYRLSGPTGPIALRVKRLVDQGVLKANQADPTFFGMDAWYGTKTTQGMKLLGPAELQALGIQ